MHRTSSQTTSANASSSAEINSPFSPLASLTKLNESSKTSSPERKSKLSKQASITSSPVTLDSVRSAAQLRNLEVLKEALRNLAWPANHLHRRALWTDLVALFTVDESQSYREAVTKLSGTPTLPPFANNAHANPFCLRITGVHAVHRLLAVVQLNQPQVTHCPMLFPLAALLLHYLSEETTYSVLTALLANQPHGLHQRYKSKPPDGTKHHLDWLIQTQRAHDICTMTVRYLVKKYTPATFSFVKSVIGEKDVLLFYDEWLWWTLEFLPLDHLMRIVDCYLLEGIKILYRVAIVLLKSFHTHAKEEHAKYPTNVQLSAAMRQHCRAGAMQSAEEVLSAAFKLRGFSKAQLLRYYARFDEFLSDHRVGLSRVNSEIPPGNRDTLSNFGGVVVPLPVEYADSLHSSLLGADQLRLVWSWLPERVQLQRPFVAFSTGDHGYNLHTLYGRSEQYEPTVLLVRSSRGWLFGAYCSAPWADRERSSGSHRRHSGTTGFFGTGETFVFTLVPHTRVFKWLSPSSVEHDKRESALGHSHGHSHSFIGRRSSRRDKDVAHAFQLGLRDAISVGGCGRDAALNLDENLTKGTSRHCATFDNDCLAEDEDFDIVAVEVIAFERT